MYFVRIDYLYKGSPVQRARYLVDSYSHARRILAEYHGADYFVLSVMIERCK